MSKAFAAAFLLILGSAVLGATAFREPLAHAARTAQSVMISNPDDQPVPVREQGKVSIHPVVPGRPWHRIRIVNTGSQPFLTEPSSSAINITSLTIADEGGFGATAFLTAVTVPDTAAECSGETGDILWGTAVTAPLAVTFPTPLVAAPPEGSRVCLRASAFGESGDHVWFSLSGFFGND